MAPARLLVAAAALVTNHGLELGAFPLEVRSLNASGALQHRIGQAEEDGWSVRPTEAKPKHLSFGPYVDDLEPGPWTVSFELMVDVIDTQQDLIATIDTFDASAGTVLASRNLFRGAFAQPMQYSLFSLSYVQVAGHKMEFRVFWYDASYLRQRRIVLSQDRQSFDSLALQHHVGRAEEDGWAAITSRIEPNFLSFGPFIDDLEPGRWRVRFDLTLGETEVAAHRAITTIDVHDAGNGMVLAERKLVRGDFPMEPMQPASFDLTYDQAAGHRTEFRVFWHGRGYLKHRWVTLQQERRDQDESADATEVQKVAGATVRELRAEQSTQGSASVLGVLAVVIVTTALVLFVSALIWHLRMRSIEAEPAAEGLAKQAKPGRLPARCDELQTAHREAARVAAELRVKEARVEFLQQQLLTEFGDAIHPTDVGGQLKPDFAFCICDTEAKGVKLRIVKIQCPGVTQEDVSTELIPNGCAVTLRRQASPGVAPAVWSHRFQFLEADGHFELLEDLARLNLGLLEITFRKHACGRTLLFVEGGAGLAAVRAMEQVGGSGDAAPQPVRPGLGQESGLGACSTKDSNGYVAEPLPEPAGCVGASQCVRRRSGNPGS